MATLKRIASGIVENTVYLGRFFLIALMVTIIFDVIGRRFFNVGSVALQELEWHFHGGLFLLCLGFTYLKDAHVRVDLFRDKFSERTNRLIEIVGCLFFLLPYCTVVIYFGIDFAANSFSAGEMSPNTEGLPYRWIIKTCLPLGFLLLGIAAVSILLSPREADDG